MQSQSIIVDAGERTVSNVKRDCRMIITFTEDGVKARLITEEDKNNPDVLDLPTVVQAYRWFHDLMKRYGLDFRRRKYQTEAEKKEARRKTQARYRKSDRYHSRTLLNKNRRQTDEEIQNDDRPIYVISRVNGIPMKEVIAIKERGNSGDH